MGAGHWTAAVTVAVTAVVLTVGYAYAAGTQQQGVPRKTYDAGTTCAGVAGGQCRVRIGLTGPEPGAPSLSVPIVWVEIEVSDPGVRFTVDLSVLTVDVAKPTAT